MEQNMTLYIQFKDKYLNDLFSRFAKGVQLYFIEFPEKKTLFSV